MESAVCDALLLLQKLIFHNAQCPFWSFLITLVYLVQNTLHDALFCFKGKYCIFFLLQMY